LKLDIIPIESARKDDNLRNVNPLKQIPVLVLDDARRCRFRR
jgi:glutathione S-transferase